MTIAVGVLAEHGVVLGADTLYTDGYSKSYRTKILNVSPNDWLRG
jgi:hypothetical protein